MNVPFNHSIDIAASRESVYSFFVHLPLTYTKWHPDHIAFRWVKGNTLVKGAVAEVEHRMAGGVRTLPVIFTDLTPNQRIAFSWGDPDSRVYAPRDMWLFEATSHGCRFVSESELILNGVSSMTTQGAAALADVRRHLAEECENLKRIVESGG